MEINWLNILPLKSYGQDITWTLTKTRCHGICSAFAHGEGSKKTVMWGRTDDCRTNQTGHASSKNFTTGRVRLAPLTHEAQHCVKMVCFLKMLQLHLLSFNANMSAMQFVSACAVIVHALLMNHLDGKPINLITWSLHHLLFIRPL